MRKASDWLLTGGETKCICVINAMIVYMTDTPQQPDEQSETLQHRRPALTDETKAVVQLCHGNGAYCMEFLCAQVVVLTPRPSKVC